MRQTLNHRLKTNNIKIKSQNLQQH